MLWVYSTVEPETLNGSSNFTAAISYDVLTSHLIWLSTCHSIPFYSYVLFQSSMYSHITNHKAALSYIKDLNNFEEGVQPFSPVMGITILRIWNDESRLNPRTLSFSSLPNSEPSRLAQQKKFKKNLISLLRSRRQGKRIISASHSFDLHSPTSRRTCQTPVK